MQISLQSELQLKKLMMLHNFSKTGGALPCLFLKVGENLKFTKILSLFLVLFVLMNCFTFVFPVSAAPPVIYPKLNIKVSKTLDDNATAILKEAGTGSVSTWNSLHEFKNSDDAYRTFGGDSTSLLIGYSSCNLIHQISIKACAKTNSLWKNSSTALSCYTV